MDASARRGSRAREKEARIPQAIDAVRLPSLRSVAVGLGLLVAGAALYVAARETSAFAVRAVVVEGASPRVARQVEEALAPLRGRSLLRVGAADVLRRVEALPEVRSARYDRAFPHTLVVTVRQERAVAVLRAGAAAWLVSARATALRQITRGSRPRLARVWAPATTSVAAGEQVEGESVRQAVTAAAGARRVLGTAVTVARAVGGELTLVLRGGRELRLGDELELMLKLTVARAVLRELPPVEAGGPTYVDVSVPGRAVAGKTLKSEVEVETYAP